MDSLDSSPSALKPTISFHANKENSPQQGRSECDGIISVTCSTCGSAISGSFALKLVKTGIKHRSNNKKTLKNSGSVRSFRRRSKSRIARSPAPVYGDTSNSHCDSLVHSSGDSPHSSPEHAESPFDSSDKNSSHSSQSKLASPSHESLQTLSGASSLRNERFLAKKTSFKPKRPALNHYKVSEDVAVDRATYASTVKDSKFVEGIESEQFSAMNVCLYHHCSLHGHCQGTHDPVPWPKRVLYKRRQSLKKQRSIRPKPESRPGAKHSSDRKKILQKGQVIAEDKNGVDSYEKIHTKQEVHLLGDGIQESGSLTSSHGNSDEEGEITAEFAHAADLKADQVVQVKDSETNSPTNNGGKLKFSEQRHLSMWHLIHQHMSSNLASVSDTTQKPLQGADGENPVDGANSMPAKSSASSGDVCSSDNGTAKDEPDVQEIEIRKIYAVKLVREAIGKILLPEVQDQASDDQATTSESTPWPELLENNQSKVPSYEKCGESDVDKGECNVSSNPKEESCAIDDASGLVIKENHDSPSPDIKKTEKTVSCRSQEKAPNHWSNLKKWILLQRFMRELEKMGKFNPRKPPQQPLDPNLEGEKVNLRPQTVDERKREEEWMLDYALRQAVSQLPPTQKRKVALLVKAFETVVPPQEDPQVKVRIPRLEGNNLDIISTSHKVNESTSEGHGRGKDEALADGKAVLASNDKVSMLGSANQETGIKMTKKAGKLDLNDGSGESSVFSAAESLILDRRGKPRATENTIDPAFHSHSVSLEKKLADEADRDAMTTLQSPREYATSDCLDGKTKDSSERDMQMDGKNHFKMWHVIYQHVVSDIAEKVGSRLLDGAEDGEGENDKSPAVKDGNCSDGFSKPNDKSINLSGGFTKYDALKLIKDAVNEILHAKLQDDSSDTQTVTSESVSEQDISERNFSEIGGQCISSEGKVLKNEGEERSGHAIISKMEDRKIESQVIKKSELPKSKNWSKLKKLILLKRSLKALEEARKLKTQARHSFPQTFGDPKPEKIDVRHQIMEERKKAEKWMLDYAVQHIVTKLTPSRKRRVSMLVEAFESVVPFPDI